MARNANNPTSAIPKVHLHVDLRKAVIPARQRQESVDCILIGPGRDEKIVHNAGHAKCRRGRMDVEKLPK